MGSTVEDWKDSRSFGDPSRLSEGVVNNVSGERGPEENPEHEDRCDEVGELQSDMLS